MTWVHGVVGLGCLGFNPCELGRLFLTLLFTLFSRPLSPVSPNALDTIHPFASASFSPHNRPPFRVGFAGKLLPVSGYAWTPSLQETVEVSWLGFVDLTLRKVSGPHRTFLTNEFGLLWLFGTLLLLFHSCLVGCDP